MKKPTKRMKPLRIVLKLEDGSEEICKVTSVGIVLDKCLMEISSGPNPRTVQLIVPGGKNSWGRLIVHHSAANAMGLEIK